MLGGRRLFIQSSIAIHQFDCQSVLTHLHHLHAARGERLGGGALVTLHPIVIQLTLAGQS